MEKRQQTHKIYFSHFRPRASNEWMDKPQNGPNMPHVIMVRKHDFYHVIHKGSHVQLSTAVPILEWIFYTLREFFQYFYK